MKRSIARIMTACFLMLPLGSLQTSCSSSEESTGEEVAANGNEEENAANPDEVANNNAAEGNVAEGNSAEENSAEGNNALANNEEAANNNTGLNQNADTNNTIAENGGAQGGEQDLQQIIEEMNGANNTQLANQAQEPMGQGQNFDNIGGQAPAESAPMANAAMGNPEATESIATTPESSSMPAPSGIAAGPGLPELGSKMVYFVQKGDTLAKIAQRIYGDGNKWTEIANFTGLANPKLIYPGDVVYYQLTERTMNFATAYEGMKKNEVQVSQGDTLATIASRVLGNSALWKLIWRQNDRIDNPDRLTAGTTIYYVDPAAVASLDMDTQTKMVKVNKEVKGSAQVAKSKVMKNNVYEVANDYLQDMFTSASKDLTKRSLI